jgi:hypothetical protein
MVRQHGPASQQLVSQQLTAFGLLPLLLLLLLLQPPRSDLLVQSLQVVRLLVIASIKTRSGCTLRLLLLLLLGGCRHCCASSCSL